MFRANSFVGLKDFGKRPTSARRERPTSARGRAPLETVVRRDPLTVSRRGPQQQVSDESPTRNETRNETRTETRTETRNETPTVAVLTTTRKALTKPVKMNGRRLNNNDEVDAADVDDDEETAERYFFRRKDEPEEDRPEVDESSESLALTQSVESLAVKTEPPTADLSLSEPETPSLPPRDAASISKVSGSCCDVRHSPGLVMQQSQGFWSTTGLYPQAFVMSFHYALKVLELDLVCDRNVEHLTLSSSKRPGVWENLATIELSPNDGDAITGDLKRHLTFTTGDIVCQELRLSIDKANADFSIVRYLRVIGAPV